MHTVVALAADEVRTGDCLAASETGLLVRASIDSPAVGYAVSESHQRELYGEIVHEFTMRYLDAPAHDGPTYNPDQDEKRLTSLRERVLSYLLRHGWCSLEEIVAACGGTTASVSAKARDLRKAKHGGWNVESERVTASRWRYRIGARP